jgi:hypothetical protein
MGCAALVGREDVVNEAWSLQDISTMLCPSSKFLFMPNRDNFAKNKDN